ncbi:iron-containing alcohol dehydrogenase [Paenibacillus radicis (ex Xue et al. 2023)]|uniref:Iron-containing alcohol dehydrogenase n=1 Tax=Paenibacillus radicis (ex Xue et al. 2023) TaxID=2972489 RepID=A0ABT1YEQ7_9BACL|nr:iron-containing alcohol dehydrogenase [Paenibacillus radicis (ex Xue et al. 2023)]MCR8631682.1 iron-containing alcohol dehydrogenase [Paenibacillus radicis (ex Xue et al. 2023)]
MKTYQFQTAGKVVVGSHSSQHTVSYVRETIGTVKSALIISQPSILKSGFLDNLVHDLKQAGIGCQLFTSIKPEPTEAQLTEIYNQFSEESFDVLIGVGGGSVLDATKLLSVIFTNSSGIRDMLGADLVGQAGIPMVLIPTTSGTGSEVTPNAIVTLPEEELKLAVVSRHLYPQLVLLDPVLTLSLPPSITAATGMDAYTHALESYISNKANPISDMFALESIRLISDSLVEVYENGSSLVARERMLLGSMYGGMALASSGTAAVHALAYPLGGKFGITHGVANSMLLTHVVEYNMDSIQDRLAVVASAMKLPEALEPSSSRAAEAVVARIAEWTRVLNIPQNLRDYGVQEEHIDSLTLAASKVTRLLNNNPKPLGLDDISGLYRKLLAAPC